MSNDSLPKSMTEEDGEKFLRGAELLRDLHEGSHFTDWLQIGEGLMAIRRTVLRVQGLSKPKGARYNDQFGKMCEGTLYSEEHLHKVERSNLLFCVENIATISAMQEGWTPAEKLAVSHPTTMAKRLRKYFKQQKQPPGEPKLKNASPMALLKDEVQQLKSAIADRDERLNAAEVRSGDPWFDLKEKSPEQIANEIVASFKLNEAIAIRDGLTKIIDDKSKPKAAAKSKTATKPKAAAKASKAARAAK